MLEMINSTRRDTFKLTTAERPGAEQLTVRDNSKGRCTRLAKAQNDVNLAKQHMDGHRFLPAIRDQHKAEQFDSPKSFAAPHERL